MPTFEYAARELSGKQVSGTLDAQNIDAVRRSLREKGLIVTNVNLSARKVVEKKKRGSKVKLDDLIIFSRQLATMQAAGLQLIEALDILGEQVENKTFAEVIKTVQKDVEGGASFTEALEKHPKAFSKLFCSMIRAGEASGMLDTILDQLAKYLEKAGSLQRKVKSAMIYPIAVTCVAIIVVLVLIIKVVPVLAEVFEDFDAELPKPTQFVVSLSHILGTYFPYITIGFVAVLFVVARYYKTNSGRYNIDKLMLNLPVFGPLLQKVAISKFARTFSTLSRSGVNIIPALEIVASTSGNKVIEDAISSVSKSIQEGKNIARPLKEANVFPPMVVRMVDVGERTGSLEEMLSKIADFYDDQVDAAVAGLTSLIEPMLIAFLGVVIGGIVIAMFLPIFKLGTIVQ
jgi:type IV pilus assembly protein PilC